MYIELIVYMDLQIHFIKNLTEILTVMKVSASQEINTELFLLTI